LSADRWAAELVAGSAAPWADAKAGAKAVWRAERWAGRKAAAWVAASAA
jgi:hypothetical protein